MRLSQNFVFRALESNKPTLAGFGIQRLGLFGSVARNEQRQNSDIDFLVEFSPGEKTADHFMGLADFLENVFHQKVDLLTPEALTPSMKRHILGEVKYFAL